MKRNIYPLIAALLLLLTGCGQSLFEGDTKILLPRQEALLPTSQFAYSSDLLTVKNHTLPQAFRLDDTMVGEPLSFYCVDFREETGELIYAYQAYCADTEETRAQFMEYQEANTRYSNDVFQYENQVNASVAWYEAFNHQKLSAQSNQAYWDETTLTSILNEMQYLPSGQSNDFVSNSFLLNLHLLNYRYALHTGGSAFVTAQYLSRGMEAAALAAVKDKPLNSLSFQREVVKLLQNAGVLYPAAAALADSRTMTAENWADYTLTQLSVMGSEKSRMPFALPVAPSMPSGLRMKTVLAAHQYQTGKVTTYFSQETVPSLLPSLFVRKIPENGHYYLYFGGKVYFYTPEAVCYREVDMSTHYNALLQSASLARPLKDHSLVNVSVTRGGSRIVMTLLLEYADFNQYANLPEDEDALEKAQERAEQDFIYQNLYCDLTAFDQAQYLTYIPDVAQWFYNGTYVYPYLEDSLRKGLLVQSGDWLNQILLVGSGEMLCGFAADWVGPFYQEGTSVYRLYLASGAYTARFYTLGEPTRNVSLFPLQDGTEVFSGNHYHYLYDSPVYLYLIVPWNLMTIPYYLPTSLPIPFTQSKIISKSQYENAMRQLMADESLLSASTISLTPLAPYGYTAAFASFSEHTVALFFRKPDKNFEVVHVKNQSIDFSGIGDNQGYSLLSAEQVIALNPNQILFTTPENGVVLYNTRGEVKQLLSAALYRSWLLSDGTLIAVGFDTEDKLYAPSDLYKAGVMAFSLS